MSDRPYRHDAEDKLRAILADSRIGEAAKRRVREELSLRIKDVDRAAGDVAVAQLHESPARSMKFCMPMPTNRANRPGQNRHWTAVWRDDERFRGVCEALLQHGSLPQPPKHPFRRVRLEATLYVWNEMDDDNALARLKPAVDWLVKKGYVMDDSRDHIERTIPEQVVDRVCPRIVLRIRPPR